MSKLIMVLEDDLLAISTLTDDELKDFANYIRGPLYRKLMESTLIRTAGFVVNPLGSLVKSVMHDMSEREMHDVGLLRVIFGDVDTSRLAKLGLGLFSKSEANEIGTPISGEFVPGYSYKAHPMDPAMFIPVSSFHSWVLEDKKAEFLRICASLGARSLKLIATDDSTSGKYSSAKVNEPIGGADVGAGASTKNENSNGFSMHYKSTNKPSNVPRLPDGLRWFRSEPLWMAMAEARLEHGASSLSVEFTQIDHFGLSAEVAAKIEGFGVSLGGGYSEARAIRQRYDVDFWPMS